jgi:hypothetical protein
MKKYIKLIIQGMALGSLILVCIAMFGIYFGGNYFSELLVNNFISYSIAAMIIGIGFSLPSIVYENEDLSLLNQFLIHISIGMVIYISVALYVGWIPVYYGISNFILAIVLLIIFALLIWLGFYIYYKKEALNINKQIKKIQNNE